MWTHILNNKKRYIIIIVSIFLFLLTAYFILPVSKPLILAFITALFIEPLVQSVSDKFKVKRRTAAISVFISFMVVFLGLSSLIITVTTIQLVNFSQDVPDHIHNVIQTYKEYESKLRLYTQEVPEDFVKGVTNNIEVYIVEIGDKAKEFFTIDNITKTLSVIPSLIVGSVVYLLSLFLIMLDFPTLKKGFYKILKEDTINKIDFMKQKLDNVILGFFKAQITLSLIIFIVSLIGLAFIYPQLAIVMSIIILIVDLLPIIGSIIIMAPWAIFAFFSGDTSLGIQLSILGIVLLVVRRVVEPKIMSRHIGLSPLTTLISLFIGLKLFGFIGLILGPLTAVLVLSAKEAGFLKINVKI